MHSPVFTDAQAAYALDVVLTLIKKQRFFLYQHDPRSGNKDPNYTLDRGVFKKAIELDSRIRNAYASARTLAEKHIFQSEQRLGVARPDLGGNKQLVQCNRYTGGLDICRVYPLSAFSSYMPKSQKMLTQHCLEHIVDGKDEDHVTPIAWRNAESAAESLSTKIWDELNTMGIRDPKSRKCVVVMETRFDCRVPDANHDLMHGKTIDMQRFPFAMGYLFCMYSQNHRIIEDNNAVFSTSSHAHVSVHHSRGEEKPTINYSANGTYVYPVMFVTVL